MNIKEIYELFERYSWRAGTSMSRHDERLYSDLWCVLISGGFKFEKADLVELRDACWAAGMLSNYQSKRPWYAPNESHYRQAVIDRNISFACAYEKLKGRKPFIFSGIDYGNRYGAYTCHGSARTQGRLVVGAEFIWKGERVAVTSFKDDSDSLIACAYQPCKNGQISVPFTYVRRKIRKRFTIKRKDLLKARAAVAVERITDERSD